MDKKTAASLAVRRRENQNKKRGPAWRAGAWLRSCATARGTSGARRRDGCRNAFIEVVRTNPLSAAMSVTVPSDSRRSVRARSIRTSVSSCNSVRPIDWTSASPAGAGDPAVRRNVRDLHPALPEVVENVAPRPATRQSSSKPRRGRLPPRDVRGLHEDPRVGRRSLPPASARAACAPPQSAVGVQRDLAERRARTARTAGDHCRRSAPPHRPARFLRLPGRPRSRGGRAGPSPRRRPARAAAAVKPRAQRVDVALPADRLRLVTVDVTLVPADCAAGAR